LADEAQALRDVTDWLDKFVRTGMPELVELRSRSDHPLHYRKLASYGRIVAVLGHIASDIDELTAADLSTEANDSESRRRLRRRLAPPTSSGCEAAEWLSKSTAGLAGQSRGVGRCPWTAPEC
jgi:hypothetical protein